MGPSVVNHYSKLIAQSVDQLLADLRTHVTTRGKINYRLYPGIRPIGVLPPGPPDGPKRQTIAEAGTVPPENESTRSTPPTLLPSKASNV